MHFHLDTVHRVRVRRTCCKTFAVAVMQSAAEEVGISQLLTVLLAFVQILGVGNSCCKNSESASTCLCLW